MDATKAFDKVLHYGLVYKLIAKGVSIVFDKLLIYWYSYLRSAVVWNSIMGECFNVICGVRQGGVLSPYLFAFYIDEIIGDVKKSGFGIFVGSVFLGCILYADDILLLSGSYDGLQRMIDICARYGKSWGICFNSSKSYYATFGDRKFSANYDELEFGMYPQSMPTEWTHARTLRPWRVSECRDLRHRVLSTSIDVV